MLREVSKWGWSWDLQDRWESVKPSGLGKSFPPGKCQTDWRCRVRLGEPHPGGWAGGPQGCGQSDQHHDRGRTLLLRNMTSIRVLKAEWREQCTQAHERTHRRAHTDTHTYTHPSKTTQSREGRWKWSLWVSPDQGWSVYFCPKKWILTWTPLNLSRSIELKGKKTLQTNRYFISVMKRLRKREKGEKSILHLKSEDFTFPSSFYIRAWTWHFVHESHSL